MVFCLDLFFYSNHAIFACPFSTSGGLGTMQKKELGSPTVVRPLNILLAHWPFCAFKLTKPVRLSLVHTKFYRVDVTATVQC